MQIAFRSLYVLSVLLPRNVPGPSRGGYPRSHTPHGTTHPASGGIHSSSQAPVMFWLQTEMSVGYDASPALHPPPMGRSPSSECIALPVHLTRSANDPDSRYFFGFEGLQNSRPMPAAPSQGLADVLNASGGPYPHESANGSHSPYAPSHILPGPMIEVPSQGSVSVQNPLGGPYSQVHLNCTIFAPVSEDNRAGHQAGHTMVTGEREALRRALCVCNRHSEYCMVFLMGIQDWDRLLSASKPWL
jgi:hypothetical protein